MDQLELIDGLPEGLLCFLVAVGMKVLNAQPLVLFVHVADDLLMTHLCLELDSFAAVHAVNLTTWFYESGHRAAHLLNLDGFAGCCSLCHTDQSASVGQI